MNTPDDDLTALCTGLLALTTVDEMTAFLRDLCTIGELTALGHRLAAARLLDAGGSTYAAVAAAVGTSTTTVTRVAHWLHHGEGGYRLVLDRTRAVQ